MTNPLNGAFMKHLLLTWSVPVLLAVGCAKQEHRSARPAAPACQTPLPTISLSPDAGAAPPPGFLAAAGGGQAMIPKAAAEAVPPVRDFDQALELRDYTEKVAGQWSEALTQFRSKYGRWPASPAELQQFQPKLVLFPAPKGFQLHWDPQSGEIHLLRAALSRPAR